MPGVGLMDLFDGSDLDAGFSSLDDPFETGRVVLAALRSNAERAPLVIAIDDLQWLDSLSSRGCATRSAGSRTNL